jgi:hypothetical protein
MQGCAQSGDRALISDGGETSTVRVAGRTNVCVGPCEPTRVRHPAAPAAANCLASADEVRRLAPKAWPKWTYGPRGERCWYSGRKPIFQKEMPAQAEAIPAPLSDATINTPSQAGSANAQTSSGREAPIGRRQPRAKDVPARIEDNLGVRSPEDEAIDRKLRICRDC